MSKSARTAKSASMIKPSGPTETEIVAFLYVWFGQPPQWLAVRREWRPEYLPALVQLNMDRLEVRNGPGWQRVLDDVLSMSIEQRTRLAWNAMPELMRGTPGLTPSMKAEASETAMPSLKWGEVPVEAEAQYVNPQCDRAISFDE